MENIFKSFKLMIGNFPANFLFLYSIFFLVILMYEIIAFLNILNGAKGLGVILLFQPLYSMEYGFSFFVISLLCAYLSRNVTIKDLFKKDSQKILIYVGFLAFIAISYVVISFLSKAYILGLDKVIYIYSFGH